MTNILTNSVKSILDENARLRTQIAELEDKCQDYLDAMDDVVSTLHMKDEKIKRLRKALEDIYTIIDDYGMLQRHEYLKGEK